MTTETAIELVPDKAGPPAWRAPVPWRTRQRVRIDVLVRRNFALSIVTVGFIALLALVQVIIATLLLAKIDHRLACVALIAGGPLVIGLLYWINYRLSHRISGRAAGAAEVAALRGHSSASEWVHVQANATDWRTIRPRTPITIAMILGWQDEAAAKEREAMPPTIVEQAANRAQSALSTDGGTAQSAQPLRRKASTSRIAVSRNQSRLVELANVILSHLTHL